MLMPRPPSSLPPSVSWIGVPFIHCHIHVMCLCNFVNAVHSVHMTSIASVHPGRGILLCCSPEGFFPFFPVKGYFWGVFPDPM